MQLRLAFALSSCNETAACLIVRQLVTAGALRIDHSQEVQPLMTTDTASPGIKGSWGHGSTYESCSTPAVCCRRRADDSEQQL